jgi:hypothetical protein
MFVLERLYRVWLQKRTEPRPKRSAQDSFRSRMARRVDPVYVLAKPEFHTQQAAVQRAAACRARPGAEAETKAGFSAPRTANPGPGNAACEGAYRDSAARRDSSPRIPVCSIAPKPCSREVENVKVRKRRQWKCGSPSRKSAM